MSQTIASLLERYYQSTSSSRGNDCLFLSTDDQNDFRETVDQYISSQQIKAVVRIQLDKEDLLSPLGVVKKLFWGLAEIVSSDPTKYFEGQVSLHPDRAYIVDFLLGKPLIHLEYQLQYEINFLHLQKKNAMLDLFYDLCRFDKFILICISEFQYASSWILNFFLDIIKNLQNGPRFLFFSAFVPFGNDKFKEQDDTWSGWSWEMECRGKLIHVPLNKAAHTGKKIYWDHNTGHSFCDLTLQEKLDFAQNLMDILCLQEAYIILKMLFEDNSVIYSNPIKNRIILLFGRCQLFLNRYEEAMISFDRLGDLGHTHNDETLMCLANLEMAYTNMYRGDFKVAKRYIAYCQKFSQTVSDDDLVLQVRYCEFLVYDAASSAYSYDKIKVLIDKLNLHDKKRELVNVLARTYSQEPCNPQTLTNEMCINYITEAIDIAKRENFELELAGAYQSLGVVNVKRNNIDGAIQYFKLSETIRSKINIPVEQARIQNGIGYLYCLKENFSDALEYFISAMRSVLNTTVVSEISSALYNIAWVYFLTGSWENSLKVLKTLWEILKIKDAKYFPFRNIHDVFILQGLNYYFLGQIVHATRAVRNSQNLDIAISDQGSMLRPLLQALIALKHNDINGVSAYISESRLYLNKNQAQLSTLHELLFHRCLVYIYRSTRQTEQAFHELKMAIDICRKNKYLNYGLQKVKNAWNRAFFSCKLDIPIPEAELTQCLYMVKQEQTMAELLKQVNGLRLCSILQKLTSSYEDIRYISSETLRLICMHFNVQGGFIYVKKAGEYDILCTYSQWKNLDYSYDSFAEFIQQNQHKKQQIFNKVSINNTLFSSVLLLPLKDGQEIIGHIVLTTYVGDFVTDANELETINFITNQFASRVVNLWQRDMLVTVSSHDQLTGLKNRQYFQKLVFDIKSCSNTVLVFIDLDNFKNYNDTYGHKVGDKLLIWFSELLQAEENKNCQVCRWGGDEFLILFTDTEEKTAFDCVSKLRKNLKGRRGFIKELEEYLKIPVSIPEDRYLDFSAGLCYAKAEDTQVRGSRMLSLADNFLYEVKKSGKAQIKSVRYTSS